MEFKKNYSIVIFLLSVALLFIIILSLPSPPVKETRLKDFPMVIGQWQGEDKFIEDKIYKILHGSELLLRVYKNTKGDMISLFIVASSVNPEAFHPAEICFSGAGAQSFKKDTSEIQIGKEKIKVTRLYIKHKDTEDITLYWFRVGKKTTYSYYIHQLNMVFDKIMRKRSISAMIRIVTFVENGKKDEAFELGKGFIKEIAPLLNKYLTEIGDTS